MESTLLVGKCVYLSDLRALQVRVPPEISFVNTPLVECEWQSQLELHPDKEFSQYLPEGFTNNYYGFGIRYNYESHTYNVAKRNMASAVENPQVAEEYLAKESEQGRVIGPLTPCSLQLQINRFGVIPKSSPAVRLIVDTSNGFSINNGIEPELCSLSYALKSQQCSGRYHEIDQAKLYLESAYHIIPVYPKE